MYTICGLYDEYFNENLTVHWRIFNEDLNKKYGLHVLSDTDWLSVTDKVIQNSALQLGKKNFAATSRFPYYIPICPERALQRPCENG